MGLEISFVDAPAAPRRDIAVVGLDSILLESPIAGEMAGVLAEDPFVEVLEGRLSVDVVGDDPGPVLVPTVTGGPLDEPLELAGCVASVVPALATAAFSPCPGGSARRTRKVKSPGPVPSVYSGLCSLEVLKRSQSHRQTPPF